MAFIFNLTAFYFLAIYPILPTFHARACLGRCLVLCATSAIGDGSCLLASVPGEPPHFQLLLRDVAQFGNSYCGSENL